jgi:hypothetical protein
MCISPQMTPTSAAQNPRKSKAAINLTLIPIVLKGQWGVLSNSIQTQTPRTSATHELALLTNESCQKGRRGLWLVKHFHRANSAPPTESQQCQACPWPCGTTTFGIKSLREQPLITTHIPALATLLPGLFCSFLLGF